MNAEMQINPHDNLRVCLEASPSKSSTESGREADTMLSLYPGSNGEMLKRAMLAPAEGGSDTVVPSSVLSFDTVVVDKVTLLKFGISTEARFFVLSSLTLSLTEDGWDETRGFPGRSSDGVSEMRLTPVDLSKSSFDSADGEAEL